MAQWHRRRGRTPDDGQHRAEGTEKQAEPDQRQEYPDPRNNKPSLVSSLRIRLSPDFDESMGGQIVQHGHHLLFTNGGFDVVFLE